jgi:hypothetical protein
MGIYPVERAEKMCILLLYMTSIKPFSDLRQIDAHGGKILARKVNNTFQPKNPDQGPIPWL